MPGRRYNPTYGATCPACVNGNLWWSPDRNPIRLCDEHEIIVRDAPGWWRDDDS